eukprot:scaffold32643_cov90-Isochrysis_galbana.AAC.2
MSAVAGLSARCERVAPRRDHRGFGPVRPYTQLEGEILPRACRAHDGVLVTAAVTAAVIAAVTVAVTAAVIAAVRAAVIAAVIAAFAVRCRGEVWEGHASLASPPPCPPLWQCAVGLER